MAQDPAVRRALCEAVVVCQVSEPASARGAANTLYGLARMQARWTELSSSMRLALLQEVVAVAPLATATQLTNMLWRY